MSLKENVFANVVHLKACFAAATSVVQSSTPYNFQVFLICLAMDDVNIAPDKNKCSNYYDAGMWQNMPVVLQDGNRFTSLITVFKK